MKRDQDQARPAITRGLLRVSKTFGQDASTSPREGAWQRAERAVSRTTGRVGHWTDRRNPEGVRGLTRGTGRGWWLVALVGVAATGLALAVRRRRSAR